MVFVVPVVFPVPVPVPVSSFRISSSPLRRSFDVVSVRALTLLQMRPLLDRSFYRGNYSRLVVLSCLDPRARLALGSCWFMLAHARSAGRAVIPVPLDGWR